MTLSGKPRIFFLILLYIVTFLIGLNIGRTVENLNETYVPPVPTPTEAPLPSSETDTKEPDDIQPLGYTRIESETCGISFLLPNTFLARVTPNNELEYTNGNERVFVTCNQDYIADSTFIDEAEASTSATLQFQEATVYTVNENNIWVLRNASRQQVLFETSLAITPLIQQTLEL